MNQKKVAARAQIIRCLCEGNSIRATARLCDCAINTVVKLLIEAGTACLDFHGERVQNLNSLLVQVDEIWAFVGCKEKRATADKKAAGQGDCWTWTALDSDSKLMISWEVGNRDESTCRDFIDDLASRLANRIQLSSDGLGTYVNAVKMAFGKNVDYGQIVKTFGQDPNGAGPHKYSPPVCTGCKSHAVTGDPIDSLISTSHVERQNLNIRMGCRRLTRLTNAFSKKASNHAAALSIYFCYYNFCRPHQTLTQNFSAKTTPAMASRLTDHVWSVEELIENLHFGPDLTLKSN